MSTVSTEGRLPASPHFSGTCVRMEPSASDSSSSPTRQSASVVSSSVGWNAARVNPTTSSAMRGMTWRDVTSISSSFPVQSPIGSLLGGDRSPAVETARVAAPVAPSVLSGSPAQSITPGSSVTSATAGASAAEHAALVRGVSGFHDFVARLPAIVQTDRASKADLHPSLLDATSRPRLSRAASTMEAPPSSCATQVPDSLQSTQANGTLENSPQQQPQQQQPRPQSPLPPSSVPSHRVRVLSQSDHCPSVVSSTMNDAPASLTGHRVSASIDKSHPNDFKDELMQRQENSHDTAARSTRSHAGQTTSPAPLVKLMATEDSSNYTRSNDDDTDARTRDGEDADGDEQESRASTISLHAPHGKSGSPFAFPAQPAQASRGSSLTSNGAAAKAAQSESTVVAVDGAAAFQRYLEHTRETVLSPQVPETERTKSLDGLISRSKELFNLLAPMETSLAETSAPQLSYPLVKVLPYDGVGASSSGLGERMPHGTSTTPSAAAAAKAAASVSTSEAAVSSKADELIASGALEPLSLTTRAYATQLPPLGPAAAMRLLGGFDRGRRNSLNSCSTTNVAYIDIVNNYCIIRLIGIGATGRAYLALDRKTNTYYAMKTVQKHSHRTAGRQFPLRPPSPSECSVLESVAPMTSLPDNGTKLPPRYVGCTTTTTTTTMMTTTTVTTTTTTHNGSSSTTTPNGGCAAGSLPLPVLCADGTSPASVTRTGCFPASKVRNARQVSGDILEKSAQEQSGLRETDVEDFGQTTSRSSGLVIPYVESVLGGGSSTVSASDNASRERALQAVLNDEPVARVTSSPQTSSLARRTADVLHSSSNSGRPPMAPSTTRATAAVAAAAAAAQKEKDKEKTAAMPAEAEMLSAVEREIRVLRRVQNHSHVVQLREVIDDDDEDCAHLIMTYAAHGPLTMVHGYDPAIGSAVCNVVRPLSRCARLLRQLADALTYVHRQRIVHNDVKPDNILLTESDNILLTDFGESVLIPKRVQSAAAQRQHSPRVENLNATVVVPHNRWKTTRGVGDSFMGGEFTDYSTSCRLQGNNNNNQSMSYFGNNLNGASQMLMTEVSFQPDSSMFLAAGVDNDGRLNGDRVVLGSPAFAAPELIGSSTCSYKSDTWSFGVVTYAVIFGRLPFVGPSISDTFDEILHAPLTFPPRESVPQGADMTDAVYEQWVQLCTKLLVREPLQRLSLSAVLRHPLFRTAAPPPSSSTSSSGGVARQQPMNSDAVSAEPTYGRRAAALASPPPDSPAARRWSAQTRQSPSPDLKDDGVSPLSRTTRVKVVGDVLSPSPQSLMGDALSRSGSPHPPAARNTKTVPLPSSDPCPSSETRGSRTAPGTPARGSPPLLANVPAPPAMTAETAPIRPSVERANASLSTLAPDRRSSLTQSLTLPQTAAPPPSLSMPAPSAVENSTTLLPPPQPLSQEKETPPHHLRERTLVYTQISDLGGSGRTASPAETSIISGSGRPITDYRLEPSSHTPISAALMMNCAVMGPTSSRTDTTSNGQTTSLAHIPEPEEMRRLVLNSRESARVRVTTPRAPSRSNSESDKVENGGVYGGSSPMQLGYTDSRADFADQYGCDVSVGGATRKPTDDVGSSSNLDDNFSRQDAQTDYYSYWNDSDNDTTSSDDGGENGETRPPFVAATTDPAQPHTPETAQIAGSPARKGFSASDAKRTPVLSTREEVAGVRKRSKASVKRTQREKKVVPDGGKLASSTLAPPPPPPPPPAPTKSRSRSRHGAATTHGSVDEGGVAVPSREEGERHRQTSKAPLPPSKRSHHRTSSPRESVAEEAKSKQSTSNNKSWFRRRH